MGASENSLVPFYPPISDHQSTHRLKDCQVVERDEFTRSEKANLAVLMCAEWRTIIWVVFMDQLNYDVRGTRQNLAWRKM